MLLYFFIAVHDIIRAKFVLMNQTCPFHRSVLREHSSRHSDGEPDNNPNDALLPNQSRDSANIRDLAQGAAYPLPLPPPFCFPEENSIPGQLLNYRYMLCWLVKTQESGSLLQHSMSFQPAYRLLQQIIPFSIAVLSSPARFPTRTGNFGNSPVLPTQTHICTTSVYVFNPTGLPAQHT